MRGDDAAAFRHAMRGVERLRREAAAPPAPPKPVAPPAPRLLEPDRAPASSAKPGGVDRRTATRLRRGQIRPDARLDLHGMTQVEAHASLVSFIRNARGAGRRCVLVVTGKGSLATGGVLRREVPRWLEGPALRAAILAVAAAQPKDGGEGALYVLLRRSLKG
jgi:DNA-nicking Smr family endonuclease